MIDLKTEKLYRLSEAARLYPGGGRHVSAIHRYRLSRRTPLECVMVGGVWMTSIESMHRHVHALTEAASGRTLSATSDRRVASSRREKAERELADAGV